MPRSVCVRGTADSITGRSGHSGAVAAEARKRAGDGTGAPLMQNWGVAEVLIGRDRALVALHARNKPGVWIERAVLKLPIEQPEGVHGRPSTVIGDRCYRCSRHLPEPQTLPDGWSWQVGATPLVFGGVLVSVLVGVGATAGVAAAVGGRGGIRPNIGTWLVMRCVALGRRPRRLQDQVLAATGGGSASGQDGADCATPYSTRRRKSARGTKRTPKRSRWGFHS